MSKLKLKRLLIKWFNNIIKSNSITKSIILILLFFSFCFLLIFVTDFYILKMPILYILLIGLLGEIITTFFHKQKESQSKICKKYNFSNLITVVFVCGCIVYYALGINDGSNINNMKKRDIISTDDIESLSNIEKFLIQEKQIFIQKNNAKFYTVQSFNRSYRNNAFLIIKMAEQGILNQSTHIDLIPHEENLEILSKKLKIFLLCYVKGIKNLHIDLNYHENSNLTKVVLDIYVYENYNINKIKQIITAILLSSVNGLVKENIIINVNY